MSLKLTKRGPLVLLGVFPATAMACGGGQTDGATPGGGQPPIEESTVVYQAITVDDLRQRMADGDPFLVNVHIPFEGDIPGTDTSIRFDEIADHLRELPEPRDSEIILYCRSGRMSAEAAATLSSLGYTNVAHLQGGFRAWESAGYPIQR